MNLFKYILGSCIVFSLTVKADLKVSDALLSDPIELKNYLLMHSDELKLESSYYEEVKSVRGAIEKSISLITAEKIVPYYEISVEEGMVTLWINDIHNSNIEDRVSMGLYFVIEAVGDEYKIIGNSMNLQRLN